jgi:sugar (pentulose or hexulose) kinase
MPAEHLLSIDHGTAETSITTHRKYTELRVAGGGSQSNAAMQLIADVFSIPVSRPRLYEASSLGAVIDAAVSVGLHPNFEVAVAITTRTGDSSEPDPEAHQIYEALFNTVYSKMYKRLQPLYEIIAGITSGRGG